MTCIWSFCLSPGECSAYEQYLTRRKPLTIKQVDETRLSTNLIRVIISDVLWSLHHIVRITYDSVVKINYY